MGPTERLPVTVDGSDAAEGLLFASVSTSAIRPNVLQRGSNMSNVIRGYDFAEMMPVLVHSAQ